jgi:hypothetical protein
MNNLLSNKTFDPSETIRGIKQLLVSDKKKIAFLFGAGTSFAKRTNGSPNIPAIAEMTDKIVAEIQKDKKFVSVINEIKKELELAVTDFNIETLLTNIEDKTRIIGNGTLNTLNKNGFLNLSKKIKEEIIKIVSIHKDFKDDDAKQLVQCDFAKWIRNAERKYAIEIFTTNYDYLFEIGLEEAEVPYYDGFTGSYMPFFNADSLEDINYLPQQTKLWKIHGSLGLHEDDKKNRIVRKNSDSDDLLIYPSALKYSDSKKMPYAAFIDRLNAFLKQDDAVLFVCGYSFADEHINERIFSALNANSTSHVYVFYYDIVKQDNKKEYTFSQNCDMANLAFKSRRITVLGTRNAIIGTDYGIWKLKREPDRDDSLNVKWFFDEDAPINTNAELEKEQKGDEVWTGEGELTLPNFVSFVDFLKKMIPKDGWKENDNV